MLLVQTHTLLLTILADLTFDFNKRGLGEENSDSLLKVKNLSLFSEPHTRCYVMYIFFFFFPIQKLLKDKFDFVLDFGQRGRG